MLIRRVARSAFATWFAVEGWQAARKPADHATRVRATWGAVQDRLGLPDAPDDRTLTWVVRAHGGAMAIAAALLAIGKAPRSAALALAGLTAPLVLANAPIGPAAKAAGADKGAFWRSVSMLGGALLAGIDHEGRPSMAWRIEHAKVDRAIVRDAQRVVADAQRDAKDAIATARREAKDAVAAARRSA
ncbi:DoxX family protein [Actinotalea sp. M2MS4P-6]|uniref:DoxX family protein n=1 Tax=Actinotalea sp. M2MS4P-6 TaxID=2983762 RepID=UPI0021E413EB|nr:DoxX family protein [Actinotalea sp. M2MS4P-6]MCV2394127.1 DoxX family protein [Actinotalea sp. M2MS4P-6]